MAAAMPHHCVDCVTTHNAILHQLCQHDHTRSVLLPDHPPEVLNCVRKGPLGGNECVLLSVALHTQHIYTHIQGGETHMEYESLQIQNGCHWKHIYYIVKRFHRQCTVSKVAYINVAGVDVV